MTYKEEVPKPQTRQARRKEIEESQHHEEKELSLFRRLKGARVRLIPIWARLFIVLICLLLSVIVGLIVGYSVVGDGEAAFRVLDPNSWFELLDFFNGK